MKNIRIYPGRCTGCMVCVLACAFHHTKRFDREIASVDVSISGKERRIFVSIHRGKADQRCACDCCEKEQEPLCVKYCVTKAIVRE